MSGKEKLNEGIRVQEIPFCPLCVSKGTLLYDNLRDRLFGAPGTWSLMRCPECGLVWLNPQPFPDDVGGLYKEYYTHNLTENTPKFATIRRLIRDSVLSAHLGYADLVKSRSKMILGKLFSRFGPIREIVKLSVMTLNGRMKGKLLDVGCGCGTFLKKMKELGWDVVGIEPDAQAVEICQKHLGLEVIGTTLEEANFPNDAFDAITMHHVIEHLLNPIGTLKECWRILKPGGKLVIVTPNVQSLGSRIFAKAWRGWEVPRHLYLFSPSTIRVCANRAGLQVIKVYTTSRSARWMWTASYLIKRNGQLSGGSPQRQGIWLRLEGLIFQMIEYALCKTGRNLGEEIVLIATK